MKAKISVALVSFFSMFSMHAFTTLNYHDMFPIYSTKSYFSMMNEEQKEQLKERDGTKGIRERIQFSSSLVAQKATNARDLNKIKVLVGDLHGRLNMVGLTYGSLPSGQTQPALLATAAGKTFTSITPNPRLDNPTHSDLNQNFGFFSLPIKYRKMGARFSTSVRILNDFVFSIHGGVVDLKQTLTHYTSKTSEAVVKDVFSAGDTLAPADKTTVEHSLMDKRTEIFTQLGVNGEDWNKTGAEDITFSLAWRHNFRVNTEANTRDWPHFIFTPHVRIAGTFGIGKAVNPDILLSLPFGNNEHHAIHANGGFCIDFHDTVALTFEGGVSHFFDRTYSTRVPTHDLQSLLFPYKTDVKVEPGKTWHASIEMNCHNFVDRLSLYAHYSYINHLKNKITLVTADSAFLPNRLEEESSYKMQVATIGLNYDVAPHMSAGFAWQAPISQRGSYKAHTLLLSGILTF